jgi:hypothetical protein
MLFRLRKYISVFALAVFLFPIVVEAAHTYEHRNDRHCTEQASTHFHAAEHHCFICDYVPVTSDKPFHNSQLLSDAIFTLATFSFEQNFVVVKHSFNFSLRAPPAIS